MQEQAFLDHVCVPMQRTHKLKTTEGVAAWLAYSAWLKYKGKKIPPQQAFISSQFYQSFIKFAEFCRSVKNLNMENYVRHMVKYDIAPVIWTHAAIYGEWIRANDEQPPLKSVQATTLYLLEYCDGQKIDIANLFDNVGSTTITDWVLTGRVSPWLLFGSTKFKRWFGELDDNDKSFLSDALNPAEWGERLKGNPNTLVQIKSIVAELGL